MSDKNIPVTSGAYHLANSKILYEPQRSNNFEIHIPGLNNITRVGADDQVITDAPEILRLSVVNTSVPTFSQEPINVSYGNTTIKFAGKPQYKNGQLTINDYIGADTKSILMAWQNKSFNVKTQKVGMAKDYKKDAYLMEYTPDYQLVRTWTLYGCWIGDLDMGQFSMENNDKKQITATIYYDYAVMDIEEE